ncbi:hypothetical protein [Poseidonibacter antarcticus]|uniref:hypothetical protein n=1 Tax=Poseidonibacter antarcticus TaxID=2478538 RepID=UPI000EF519A4|nr:hypothetical protein [Poseidonibacter antarcticus]
MNYLLAKIKGRGDNFLKVIATRDSIFEVPDLSNNENYAPTYKLDDDEWFRLDNFLGRTFRNGLIERTFSGTNHNQILPIQYKDIIYLCCKQDNLFLFQKLSQTQLLSKKWLHISDSPSLQRDKPIIVINDWIDAIYNKDEDILYFKDIVKIKQMFNGIGDLYREATQVEVNTFLNKDFISLGNNFTSASVKVANRRRIAMALDTLSRFTDDEVIQICDYTQSYCVDLNISNNTFVIETEDHLKLVLFGIEQRYYTTLIGTEKRLANSILEM